MDKKNINNSAELNEKELDSATGGKVETSGILGIRFGSGYYKIGTTDAEQAAAVKAIMETLPLEQKLAIIKDVPGLKARIDI